MARGKNQRAPSADSTNGWTVVSSLLVVSAAIVLFYASNRDDWITSRDDWITSSEWVVLDNVLLGGRVFDEAEQGERVTAMRQVNDRVAADDRVDAVMLPVRDGVTVARRR